MLKYLITGAAGQLGQLVIQHLATRVDPSNIIALVRSDAQEALFASKGIATRRGDYNDPASLKTAFAGVDRLLFISSPDIGSRTAQHRAVIDAAKAAEVGFIAYTSLLNATDSPMMIAAEHQETETSLSNSGIPHTLLRNGWYSENALMTLSQELEMGQRFGASGDGKYSYASRNDYAEAAAVVMAGGHDGKVLELAGDTGITLTDYTTLLSDMTGKPVTYVDMPQDALQKAMQSAGLPAPLAAVLADSEAKAAKGSLFDDSQSLSELIGRPTTPMSDILSTALAG